MASFIWDRLPQEAYANPYEYEAQDQFLREAEAFLVGVHPFFSGSSLGFHRDDISVEKAIWMLQIDAFDALRDCLQILREKRHRVAGRLFRDIAETLDLAAYFHSNSDASLKNLEKWYNDEVIPHRVYRDYIKSVQGEDAASAYRAHYSSLSKFTHRTYRSLAYGYTLGAGDRLVYEGVAASGILIPPHTVSLFLALTADLMKLFSSEIVARGAVSREKVEGAWEAAFESVPVPRRFEPLHTRLAPGLTGTSSAIKAR